MLSLSLVVQRSNSSDSATARVDREEVILILQSVSQRAADVSICSRYSVHHTIPVILRH